MALQNAFGDLALDATSQQIKELQQSINTLNDTMLVLLSAILEKMPRVTGTDQAAVVVENTPAVTVSSGTVTTVSTLSNTNSAMGKPMLGDNLNMAGTQHIYGNITVS